MSYKLNTNIKANTVVLLRWATALMDMLHVT